ncbi:hypothetical protein EJ06DRAFT_476145 [Trichodelitschia bisporula]|uniref:Uncharacterized protein n=1 Tax=Trichodelitschia bisporula TaxID=703511 RepID=A0A6G1HXN0_9PEZI|nr:hypothetical protein EJ06DRAFT_476145 [Trichodelitschia bisporula]
MGKDEHTHRPTKFRFKSKKRRSEHDSEPSSKRRRSHRSHSHRSHRHHSPKEDKAACDSHNEEGEEEEQIFNPRLQTYQSPTTLFRASLHDALANDEGALFWESVYGQPIHTYPNTKPGPDGELERMSDAEYAEYVRTAMWERSHEHIVEERAARERDRAKRREAEVEKEARRRREAEEFARRVEASRLRAGERRATKRTWDEAWDAYVAGWARLMSQVSAGGARGGKAARGIIPWPVESGRWADVDRDRVAAFFAHALPGGGDGGLGLLKTERVRWHPDKMQQRLGVERMDEDTLAAVTAVFQVVDEMWGVRRGGD